MKLAIIRGDFASPWELQNFTPLCKSENVSLYTGLFPVSNLGSLTEFKIIKLLSPADINFGRVSRIKMAIVNRMFGDAHFLFGLENNLKKVDIAHCAETYFGFTQQAINAKRMGFVKRVVSTVWENIPFNNESIPERKKFKIRSYNNIDLFLAPTQGAKNALIAEGVSAKKIKVLQPGVDLSHFSKKNVIKYRNLTLNTNIKILFVGRLVEEKGIRDILNIYLEIKKEFPNIELIIVGNGPLSSLVTNTIFENKDSNITWYPSISYDDMPKIYSISDIFIHNSKGSSTWLEQYGMVIIEALSCGLPIIALNKGSLPEIIGTAGLLANLVSDLKNNLIKLIQNEKIRENLSRKAVVLAKKKYDRNIYSNKLLIMYKKLLEHEE